MCLLWLYEDYIGIKGDRNQDSFSNLPVLRESRFAGFGL